MTALSTAVFVSNLGSPFARDARQRARKERRVIELRDLQDSVPSLVRPSGQSRWRAAIHEADYALVGVAVGRLVSSVSIAAEIEADAEVLLGGSTLFSGKDSDLYSAFKRASMAVLRAVARKLFERREAAEALSWH